METQYTITPCTEIDYCEWNDFVLNHPQGHRMQTSYWAQTKALTGWDIHYLCARQNGNLVGGAQLYERHLPIVGSVICLPKGPICADCGADLLPELECKAREWAKTHHTLCLLIQPASQGEQLIQHLLTERYAKLHNENIVPPGTIIIDLQPDQDTLFKNLSRAKQRNIKRARKSGIKINISAEREYLDIFYSLYLKTSDYLEFDAAPKKRFENIWECLAPEGHIVFFTSYYEDQPLSSIIALSFGDSVVSYRFGWSKEHPEKRPNDAIFWEAILWAKQNGYRYFDFGEIELDAARKLNETGILPEEYIHTSVFFKLGFGGNTVLYPETYVHFTNPIVQRLFIVVIDKFGDFPPVKKILSAVAG